ncbi:MAG: plastocyanin/azurin family copper-binding protein [Chloroflexota bacterium]|nr:plastocyanin/azurin family copper-binding protein [Chloroflexota bacterium]
MYKKLLVGLVLLSMFTLLLAACGIEKPASIGAGGPSVKMGTNAFLQASITVPKGKTLTLIDSAAAPHIIQNGSWVNGTAKTTTESGAPTLNMSFSGSDTQATPPFTTAGTFHIYCTIHSGMNLTVIVQ